jgi:hypothetical protein
VSELLGQVLEPGSFSGLPSRRYIFNRVCFSSSKSGKYLSTPDRNAIGRHEAGLPHMRYPGSLLWPRPIAWPSSCAITFRATFGVDAILVGTEELLGKGESANYLDSIKTLVFLTDGFPTLPSGDCTPAGTEADTDLAISAARQAGNLGISVHVFALGEEVLSNPRAAAGIATESGGTYTAVTRPADVLAVVDKLSAVGVDSIQVTNETIQQEALQSRLAADGFFASAVPVVEGLNRIQVLGRARDGSLARDAVTVNYQPGTKRSLDLEIFLEREKNLKLEVDRLNKSPDQIQRELEARRREGLKKSLDPSPAADNTSK